MNLHVIDTGLFKLDGGAMFGVVPKVLWNKLNPADENNLCNWAMRCLLVENGNRLILIDTGIGDKQDDKFFHYYYLSGDQTLENSIRAKGFSPEDVTDVFLTHLHFDHVGGAVKWNKNRDGLVCRFPNATYWSHEKHWKHALAPNPRERASFLRENILPIEEAGQLKFLRSGEELIPGFSFIEVNGHTESMMLPKINYKGRTVIYMADLIPSRHHVPVNYVMGYDIRPLDTMKERLKIHEEALQHDYIYFFEHDPEVECGTVRMTEKGMRLDQTFPLVDL
ncbi:MAG: MBL fold metallo-hydrolase [Bacteroidetes bacterium]|nr:MBL fold metallo-hydrolase [Bacteroidota bacterium]